MITIGSMTWDVPCKVVRNAEMRSSDISGVLLDRTYFNDVMGTYMSYEVSIAVPVDRLADYYSLYETLTAPVDGQTVVMPYNGDTVQVTGRISNVKDEYVRVPGGRHWKGITFTVIANHPTKEVSLGDVVTIGMSPIPESVVAPIGQYFVMTAGGLVAVDLTDADNVSY